MNHGVLILNHLATCKVIHMFIRRVLSISCWIIAIMFQNLEGKEFFFLALEDEAYENPANWYPSYPGINIHEGDTISILADVYLKGYHLYIYGQLEVQLGITIHLLGGNVLIREGGVIQNGGRIIADKIENYGYLNNTLSAEINVHEYVAKPGSRTFNASSAKFITIKQFYNLGIFNNYNYCLAGDIFRNYSLFRQGRDSMLEINGKMFLSNDSIIFLSRDSNIKLGDGLLLPSERFPRNIFRSDH